jgi:hypothetical protein
MLGQCFTRTYSCGLLQYVVNARSDLHKYTSLDPITFPKQTVHHDGEDIGDTHLSKPYMYLEQILPHSRGDCSYLLFLPLATDQSVVNVELGAAAGACEAKVSCLIKAYI